MGFTTPLSFLSQPNITMTTGHLTTTTVTTTTVMVMVTMGATDGTAVGATTTMDQGSYSIRKEVPTQIRPG